MILCKLTGTCHCFANTECIYVLWGCTPVHPRSVLRTLVPAVLYPLAERPVACTPSTHVAPINGVHMCAHFTLTQIQPTCQTHNHSLENTRKHAWGPCVSPHSQVSRLWMPRWLQDHMVEGQPVQRSHMGVSHHVGARSWTWILCKSSQCLTTKSLPTHFLPSSFS